MTSKSWIFRNQRRPILCMSMAGAGRAGTYATLEVCLSLSLTLIVFHHSYSMLTRFFIPSNLRNFQLVIAFKKSVIVDFMLFKPFINSNSSISYSRITFWLYRYTSPTYLLQLTMLKWVFLENSR